MDFKASPSSQHQHCTDEAQGTYLTLLSSDTLLLLFQNAVPEECGTTFPS